jgi:serine phosphatase RsbU (regulator of sigma subunit)
MTCTRTVDAVYVRRLLELGVPSLWLTFVVAWELTCPPAAEDSVFPRVETCGAFLLGMVYLLAGVRRGPLRELRQARAVAQAAQQVLLRPLPPRIEGLMLAGRQLSASGGAEVGGDLYEALATPHGVRVVIGDVRGHGLGAIGAVAAVLGSFREAAHDEERLEGVLRRLDRAHQRHLREPARQELPAAGSGTPLSPAAEEFVTVLLLEIGPDDDVVALNCGHPWPYRLGGGATPPTPLSRGEPLPPLGAFPLPDELLVQDCGRLQPGEALFLHTDGATDARDPEGRFFALEDALAVAAGGEPLLPAALVRQVHSALLRHTRGRVTDDVGLLVLRNDRTRVPARSGEPALRRTRPEPSHP